MASRIDQNTSNSHFDLQFRESKSESESKSEKERAPLRVLRSLVSVCLVCLAAVVVAHRVPPPVSARGGRSFFSLARGPGAGCRCRAHRWDAAGRQCPFVPPVAEPRLGQPVRRIKGTVSYLLVCLSWALLLLLWVLGPDHGPLQGLWLQGPSIEPKSQKARGTQRANEPRQGHDKGSQPPNRDPGPVGRVNVRDEARTQSPEKSPTARIRPSFEAGKLV